MANFYGVEGVKFLSHGEWADPEVVYKNHVFFAFDVEESLRSAFIDCNGSFDEDDDVWDEMEEWAKENPQEVYNCLDDIIFGQSEFYKNDPVKAEIHYCFFCHEKLDSPSQEQLKHRVKKYIRDIIGDDMEYKIYFAPCFYEDGYIEGSVVVNFFESEQTVEWNMYDAEGMFEDVVWYD